jgi:flagellar protein FlbD
VIEATRLNGLPVLVNAELIKFIEATPDTLITLTTGEKIMVKESVEVVAQRVLQYRRLVWGEPAALRDAGAGRTCACGEDRCSAPEAEAEAS